MKEIISVNNKFMSLNPNELIDLVKTNSKYTKGFELYVDYFNPVEVNYLIALANACSKENYYFQIHGNSSLSMADQLAFMNILEDLSSLFDYKINVVMHPLNGDTKEESIKITTDYVNELTSKINNDHIQIALENLNDITSDVDRLNKDDIKAIVCNNENVYMTYDMGHDLIDGGAITDLDPNLIPLIRNVHIHTFSYDYSGGFDHKPILKNDEHWNQVLKGILFLVNNKYDGPVVFEYGLDSCYGDTVKDKIISYLNSMDEVGSRFI